MVGKKGFSLVEISVALALAGLVTLNSFRLFSTSNQFANQASAFSDLDLLVSKIVNTFSKQVTCDQMLRDIGGSSGITFDTNRTFTFNSMNSYRIDPDTGQAEVFGSSPIMSVPSSSQLSTLTTSSSIGAIKPFSIFYYISSLSLIRDPDLNNDKTVFLEMKFNKVPGSQTLWPSTIFRKVKFKGIILAGQLTSCQTDEFEKYNEILNETCEEITGIASVKDANNNFVECIRHSYSGIASANDLCRSTQSSITGFDYDTTTRVFTLSCGNIDLQAHPNSCPGNQFPESFNTTGGGTFGDCSNLQADDISVGPLSACPLHAPLQRQGLITTLQLNNGLGITCL